MSKWFQNPALHQFFFFPFSLLFYYNSLFIQSAVYDLHFYHHFFMLLQLALSPAVQPTATWDVMVGNSSSCSITAAASGSPVAMVCWAGGSCWCTEGRRQQNGAWCAVFCIPVLSQDLEAGCLHAVSWKQCHFHLPPLPFFFFPSLLYSCVLGRICGFVT